MPTATQSDDNSVTMSTDALKWDEFLPIVKFDTDINHYQIDDEKLTLATDKNDKEEEVELSEYLDKKNRSPQILLLETVKKKIKIPFTVKKGSSDSYDDDGLLNIKLSIEDKGIKLITKKEFKTKYDSTFNVEIEFTGNAKKEFYIDFYARDNEDDTWSTGELVNIHCGRFKVNFEYVDKIGLRLTSNIEALIKTPSGYDEPPTYSEPLKTFNVANVYQNPYGMCFAVSMARVRKAYLDEFGVEVISLNLSGQDYLYSGTIVNNIPPAYFGYGVGGRLAMKGHAELVSESEIWEGKLEEGAMIQYWNGTSLSNVFKKIKKRDVNDPQYGHSVVFKSYIKIGNKITGMKIYDYAGIHKKIFKVESKIVLGANLKDIQ